MITGVLVAIPTCLEQETPSQIAESVDKWREQALALIDPGKSEAWSMSAIVMLRHLPFLDTANFLAFVDLGSLHAYYSRARSASSFDRPNYLALPRR